MTIRVTREQLGQILGFFILVGLAIGLSGGIVSWVVWDIDPSNWSPTTRAWHAALALIVLIMRWIYGLVEVGDDTD